MEQLRLRSHPTVAGPVRRTAGHRRQKGRLLSTLRLAEDPELLHRLQKAVATDVKFVHVVRNPYDNVAATLKRPPVYVSATRL